MAKRMGPSDIILEIYRNCGEALEVSDNADPVLIQKMGEFRDALGRVEVICGCPQCPVFVTMRSIPWSVPDAAEYFS